MTMNMNEQNRNVMKYLALLFPLCLSACMIPVVDGEGNTYPLALQASPIVIDASGEYGQHLYVCHLQAFTQTFNSENISQGKAKRDVQKQCLKRFHAMFCEVEAIQCTRY